MVLTNETVQELLKKAIEKLQSFSVPADEVDAAKQTLLLSYLVVMKGYTASGNDIPALGGLGLQEAVAIAEDVISDRFSGVRRVNFKHLGKGFIEV